MSVVWNNSRFIVSFKFMFVQLYVKYSKAAFICFGCDLWTYQPLKSSMRSYTFVMYTYGNLPYVDMIVNMAFIWSYLNPSGNETIEQNCFIIEKLYEIIIIQGKIYKKTLLIEIEICSTQKGFLTPFHLNFFKEFEFSDSNAAVNILKSDKNQMIGAIVFY